MKAFWESKKWLGFGLAVVIGLVTFVINNMFPDLSIDPNMILAMVGLNGLYILAQGHIDSKKSGGSPTKAFFESNKAIAMLVGDLVPLIVGFVKVKFDVEIPPEVVYALIGLDGILVVRQGAIDAKNPDQH